MPKRRMSLHDAMDFVPDDLPDGAYFAMLHEVAGAEYGEAWGELESDLIPEVPRPHKCPKCRGRFKMPQHRDQHFAAKHAPSAEPVKPFGSRG